MGGGGGGGGGGNNLTHTVCTCICSCTAVLILYTHDACYDSGIRPLRDSGQDEHAVRPSFSNLALLSLHMANS